MLKNANEISKELLSDRLDLTDNMKRHHIFMAFNAISRALNFPVAVPNSGATDKICATESSRLHSWQSATDSRLIYWNGAPVRQTRSTLFSIMQPGNGGTPRYVSPGLIHVHLILGMQYTWHYSMPHCGGTVPVNRGFCLDQHNHRQAADAIAFRSC